MRRRWTPIVEVGPSTAVDKEYFKVCVRDVAAAAKLVEQNYVGYADKMNDRGGEISKALSNARRIANGARSEAECSDALGRWVKSFGDGHLQITMAAPAASHSMAGWANSSGVVGSWGQSAFAVSAPVGATVMRRRSAGTSVMRPSCHSPQCRE